MKNISSLKTKATKPQMKMNFTENDEILFGDIRTKHILNKCNNLTEKRVVKSVKILTICPSYKMLSMNTYFRHFICFFDFADIFLSKRNKISFKLI